MADPNVLPFPTALLPVAPDPVPAGFDPGSILAAFDDHLAADDSAAEAAAAAKAHVPAGSAVPTIEEVPANVWETWPVVKLQQLWPELAEAPEVVMRYRALLLQHGPINRAPAGLRTLMQRWTKRAQRVRRRMTTIEVTWYAQREALRQLGQSPALAPFPTGAQAEDPAARRVRLLRDGPVDPTPWRRDRTMTGAAMRALAQAEVDDHRRFVREEKARRRLVTRGMAQMARACKQDSADWLAVRGEARAAMPWGERRLADYKLIVEMKRPLPRAARHNRGAEPLFARPCPHKHEA